MIEKGTSKLNAVAEFKARPGGLLRALTLACLSALLLAGVPHSAHPLTVRTQDNESLFSKIESIVKEKEPDWKLEQKHERKGAEHKYFMHGWTLDKEYVSTTTYQFKDTNDAAKAIVNFIRSPVSVPVRTTRIEGMGDEAYTSDEGPYGKKGSGTLIVRRVNLIIRLDASSLETAKRFAQHMLDAVEAVCGGAHCEPMN